MAVPEANSQHDADRVPLGRLLVDSGLLDAADLERVLEEQRRTGAPLGRMLVDGGYVASSTIAMALADQHGGLLKSESGVAGRGRSRAERIDDWESRLAEQPAIAEQAEPAEPTYDDGKHVLLAPSETGFVTLERLGPAPQPGDMVVLPIGRYKVPAAAPRRSRRTRAAART